MPTKRSNTYQGRKIRTGPRGGKYILRGGKKRYLSGGQACAIGDKKRCKKSSKDDGNCYFAETKRCRKKKAKKKPKLFNNEHLIDTFDIDFNGSNLSFFKELLKTKELEIYYYYDQFIIEGTIVKIKDGIYYDIETFIGSNLSKFTSLTELTLSSRFSDDTYEWIKERPPKLKKLTIDYLHFIKSIPSILTKGLDILEISSDIDEMLYIRDGDLSMHEKIKKVIFSNVYLIEDFNTEEELPVLIQDLTLLYKYFPDSKIIGFLPLINSLPTDAQDKFIEFYNENNHIRQNRKKKLA